MRRKLSFLAAWTCCLFVLLPALAADPVLEWNQTFIRGMKRDTLAPPIIARNLALLHSALWEAYRKDGRVREPALHLVAFKMSSSLLPGHSATFEAALETAYPEKIRDEDREFADACVTKTLRAAAGDGASSHVTYTAKGVPGSWFRTAPFFRAAELPHWSRVRPSAIPEAGAFRAPGPPPLSSDAYAKAWKEIRELGGKNSSLRTEEQTLIAKFWSDFSYTETPVGHWNSIARTIIQQKQLSSRDTARLLHLVNTALADAAIACWDTKYTYDFWRPITAIQKADLDGNPETEADPDWAPLLNTPNHPEYVSGHSAFGGAACAVLSSFFGTDALEFDVQSDTLPGTVRRFQSLKECVRECSLSRIYGGIHFRFSCEDGIELGAKVGAFIWQRGQAVAP